MNPEPEMADSLFPDISGWAIPLQEAAPTKPTRPADEFPAEEGFPTILPFRLDELPTEGFAPRLRRFDEVA
jgi:hypothetical protein